MKNDFHLVNTREIKEIDSQALLYVHNETKTEVLFLKNSDDNKVFGITFRTPPPDSTGLPHILEHSVLCGSKKYPVKEPFVELLKGSLQTFLNAFTYPDKTCYPVASTHPKDIRNLIDVYLDAVFNPLVTVEIFKQEGWHFHKETPDHPLEIRGVVYNEMKGAYSSPDRLLMEAVQQSLFPDHPYGLDSGGDPKDIPTLTYERFIGFYRTYYHPSNAKIFFYGNGSLEDELTLIGDYLKGYTYQEIPSMIPPVKPFDGVRRIEKFYPSSPEGSGGGTFATLNCLLPETVELEYNLAFQVLYYILLGMAGSPLRKVLIESGLGEDLAGVGLETELKYLYFSTGLRGLSEVGVDKMFALVDETLRKVVSDGIAPSTVEAALNTVEFRYRECNTGGYPRGLFLMLTALTTWLYGGDPLALLAFEKPLADLRKRIESDRFYFSGLVERFILENPHKSLVILKPDPELFTRLHEKEHSMLKRIEADSTSEEQSRIISDTLRLKEHQERKDDPKDLKKIPRLNRSDLSSEVEPIPRIIETLSEDTLLMIHPLETHGITYLDLGFPFHGLDEGILPYLPLFCTALLEMGTTEEDYTALSERISRLTGGIQAKLHVENSFFRDSSGIYYLFLRGKVLTARFYDLLNIMRDIITKAVFDSKERIWQILLKCKASRYQRIIPEGHLMVLKRVKSHFSKADKVQERMKGLSHYLTLKTWVDDFEHNWSSFRANFYDVKATLFTTRGMVVNVASEESSIPDVVSQLRAFMDTLPDRPPYKGASWQLEDVDAHEGFIIPSQVHYVAKGGELSGVDGYIPGWFLTVINYLRTGWLWDRIRVQGGAYGVHCFVDRASRFLGITSYRDPHLVATEKIFDGVGRFLKEAKLTEDELTKSIIGTIGKLDPPMFPDSKSYTSMIRYLTGESEPLRKKLREEVLGTEEKDFKVGGELLDEWSRSAFTKALGPGLSLEEAVRGEWNDRSVKLITL